MTTPINVSFEEIEKLYARTWEKMDTHFQEAFGLALNDRVPAIEERFEDTFGVEVSGVLLVLQGVVNMDVKEQQEQDGEITTDAASDAVFEFSIDAVSTFLAGVPHSIYNDDILSCIASCWSHLGAVSGTMGDGDAFAALHFLMGANYDLGQAKMLLAWRAQGRTKASKAGQTRHKDKQAEKRKAADLYHAHFAGKPLSAAQIANRMYNSMGVNYNPGGLTRFISSLKKADQGPSGHSDV